MKDKTGKQIKIGDVLESRYGHRYEVVALYCAYHDDNYLIPSANWHTTTIVGNVKDDPSLSVAVHRVRD